MPRAETCLLNLNTLTVDEALRLRDAAKLQRERRPDFRCIDCNQPVKAHREGSHGAAHFEHFERNPTCQLSDPLRS